MASLNLIHWHLILIFNSNNLHLRQKTFLAKSVVKLLLKIETMEKVTYLYKNMLKPFELSNHLYLYLFILKTITMYATWKIGSEF